MTTFSPDGRLLATAERSDATSPTEEKAPLHQARLWDAHTGQPVGPPMKHTKKINTIDFSPDSQVLVTAGDDRIARLWDTRTALPKGDGLEHDGPVLVAWFSRNGRWIATADKAGAVRIWHADGGKLQAQATVHGKDDATGVWFSPDSTQVLASTESDRARLWHAATGMSAAPQLPGSPAAAPFSPDGRYLLTTDSTNNRVLIWDLAARPPAVREPTRKIIPTLGGGPEGPHLWDGPDEHHAPITQVHETGKEKRPEIEMRIWDLGTGEPVAARQTLDGRVQTVRFSPDGSRIAVLAVNGAGAQDAGARAISALWLCRGDTGEPLFPPRQLEGQLVQAVFRPDGRYLLLVLEPAGKSGAREATLWDAATGQASGTPLTWEMLPGETESSIDGVRYVPRPDGADQGKTNNADNVVTLGGAVRIKVGGSVSCGFTPDSRRLVHVRSSAPGKNPQEVTVKVLDGTTGEPVQLWSFAGQLPPPPSVGTGAETRRGTDLSPDGRRLVLAYTQDGLPRAQVWDLETGAAVGPVLSGVGDAVFHPDGRRLITTTASGEARLRDIDTGKPLTLPMQNPGAMLALSPDGGRVFVGPLGLGVPGNGKVWDAATGELLSPSLEASPHDWDIPADPRPVEDLRLLARVLSGSRIDETGANLPLEPDEFRSAWKELHSRGPGTVGCSADEVLAWHRERANRNPLAALPHLDALLAAGAPERGLYQERGDVRAMLGQWEGAVADLARAADLEPADPWPAYLHALALRRANQDAACRVACRRLLERYGATESPYKARLVVWACALVPDAGVDPQQVLRLAERLLPGATLYNFQLALAAARLRAGRPEAAVTVLEAAVKAGPGTPEGWLLLALAHQRLGHAGEAGSSLEKAKDKPVPGRWDEQLELDLLRREAEAGVRGKEPH
jgi:WD40 repeat protein/tetratricopeptide (TPR) repeat protein